MISIFRNAKADFPLDINSSDMFTIEHVRDLIKLKLKMSDISDTLDNLDRWPFIIKDMQSIECKKDRDSLKITLPSIIFAAKMKDKFTGISSSGFYCVDLDFDDNKDFFSFGLDYIKEYIFEHMPSAQMAFISPSRKGIKVVHKISLIGDKETPYNSFLSVYNFFFSSYELIGLHIDTKCKNWNRLCFLSYDRDCLYREAVEQIINVVRVPTIEINSNVSNSHIYTYGKDKSQCPKCKQNKRFRSYEDGNGNIIRGSGVCDRVNTCGTNILPKDLFPNKKWFFKK